VRNGFCFSVLITGIKASALPNPNNITLSSLTMSLSNSMVGGVNNEVVRKNICPNLQRQIDEYRMKLHDFSLEEEEKQTVFNFISIDYKNRLIRNSGFAWNSSQKRRHRSIAYFSLYSLLDLLRRQNPVSIHNECLPRFDFWIAKLKGYFKGEWLDELVAFSQFLHQHDNDKYCGNKGTVSRLEFKEKYLIDWYNTVMELQARPDFSDEIFEEEALNERFEVFEKNLMDIKAQIMEVKNALKLRAELASFEFDISSPTAIIRNKYTKVEPPIP